MQLSYRAFCSSLGPSKLFGRTSIGLVPAIELGKALGPRGQPVCLGMPTVDKLILGSALHPISQPMTRKQRFARGQCASWLLCILSASYLEVLEVPSAREQRSAMAPRTTPATMFCLIPPPAPSFAHGVGLSVTTGKQ